MLIHRIVIAGLLLSGAAQAAQAAPVTFDLAGTVTQATSSVGVTAGEQIPIAITIDDAYPATVPGGGTYSSGLGGNEIVTSALFAGTNIAGDFQTVTVTPGFGIAFNTGSQQTSAGFDLALFGTVAGALPTTALPSTLSASEFTAGTFSVTELNNPTTVGFSGIITGLAGSATPVPEPTSWAMLALGVLGLAVTRRHVS